MSKALEPKDEQVTLNVFKALYRGADGTERTHSIIQLPELPEGATGWAVYDKQGRPLALAPQAPKILLPSYDHVPMRVPETQEVFGYAKPTMWRVGKVKAGEPEDEWVVVEELERPNGGLSVKLPGWSEGTTWYRTRPESRDNFCFNRDGQLVWELLPSARDEAHYAACRYETFEDAVGAALRAGAYLAWPETREDVFIEVCELPAPYPVHGRYMCVSTEGGDQ